MGRKRTREGPSATSDLNLQAPILEYLRDIPQEQLESALMQALAVGASYLARFAPAWDPDPRRSSNIIQNTNRRPKEPAGRGTQSGLPTRSSLTELLEQIGVPAERASGPSKPPLCTMDESEWLEPEFSRSIERGLRYEREIARTLHEWAAANGGSAEHVGADNRPGDIVVEFPTRSPEHDSFRLVIEVRSRRKRIGRTAVSAAASEAMTARSAEGAIYLSRTAEGLAQELGDWAEGECGPGPFVACTHEHLATALRYLHTRKKIARLRRSSAYADETAIQGQVVRIRTALDTVRKISRLGNEIRSATWEIDDELDRLRQEIRDALRLIEDALRDQPNHDRTAEK